MCFRENSNGGSKRACGILLFNHWKHVSTTTILMATKRGRVVTYIEGLLPIKSHEPSIAWPWKITWKIKNISPLLQCSWPPNLAGWLHTMKELHIRLHGPLITWSYVVSWKSKYIISPLPQGILPPELARWWLTMKVFHPYRFKNVKKTF